MAVDTVVVMRKDWPARQFIPGGSANKFVDSRMFIAVNLARGLAPSRTGELKSKIRKTGTLNQGVLAAVSTIYCDADHAWFVHEGTDGARVRKGQKRMPVPRAPGGLPFRVTGPVKGGFVYVKKVRGQVANPFLSLAVVQAFEL